MWIHLRSFRKRLFDLVPTAAFQLNGKWIEHCIDYTTMIQIVELSTKAVRIISVLIVRGGRQRADS